MDVDYPSIMDVYIPDCYRVGKGLNPPGLWRNIAPHPPVFRGEPGRTGRATMRHCSMGHALQWRGDAAVQYMDRPFGFRIVGFDPSLWDAMACRIFDISFPNVINGLGVTDDIPTPN